MFIALVYLASIYLNGFLLWNLFRFKKINPLIDSVIYFSLGLLILTALFHILGLAGFGDFFTGVYASGTVLSLLITIYKLYKKEIVLDVEVSSFVFELLIIIVLMSPFIYSSLINPLIGWDTRAIWLIKAKALFEDISIPTFYHANIDYYYYSHPSYPLGLSSVLAGLYRFLGFAGEFQSKIVLITPFINLFILFVGVFRHLKVFNYRIFDYFAGFLIVISGMFQAYAHNGYADLWVSLLLGVLIVYLIINKFSRKIEGASRYFMQILLLATSLIYFKNEGLTIFAFLALGYTIYLLYSFKKGTLEKISRALLIQVLRKQFRQILILLLLFLPFLIWLVVKKINGIETNILGNTESISTIDLIFNEGISRLRVILPRILTAFFTQANYGITALLLTSSAIFLTLSSSRVRALLRLPNMMIAVFIITLQLATYVAIYVITRNDLTWHLNTSVDRLVMHVAPSVMIIAMFVISKVRLESDSE